MVPGVGSLVQRGHCEKWIAERSPGDDQGKQEGTFDIRTSGNLREVVTHQIHGGKLGALLEVRDRNVSQILERLDDIAFTLSHSVNAVHEQGVSPKGESSISFFSSLEEKKGSAQCLKLSEPILRSAANIVTARVKNTPGDNQIAIDISRLQDQKILNEGFSTLDEGFNAIIANVGVDYARSQSALNQQKEVMTQLERIREQISGVSVDEETTNLIQFQHIFDASAKVIQIADEMLKTVLSLARN